MKLHSLLNPSAGGNSAIAHLLLFVSILLAAQAISFNPVPDPNLELSQLGRIGLAGDFAGVSLYKYEGQGPGGGSNGNQSVLGRYPDGGFGSLAESDGVIHALCPFVMDGELAGVIVAGNFTSLGGLESQGVALFNPNTSEVTPLPGISGQVNTLYCDDESNTVYVGGNFKGANSTNGIAWVGTAGWTNLPFLGFNGPVTSIIKANNGKMVFGGSFTGLGNATVLEEEHQQVINLSSAEISSEGSTSVPGYNDPKNVVCKTSGTDGPGNTWLLEDGQPGAWKAEFGYGFQPSKLTLWNTHQDGRGTKTWRFTAYGGIMNFTYVDPADGAKKSCSSECPLSDDPAIESQDFFFVNTVGMAAFRIDISEWYGNGGGLNGIQLNQNDIYSYAINEFNEPECSVPSTSAISKATITGPWQETESFDTNSRYLTAEIEDPSQSNAEVVFYPHIRQSGNYSVQIYTPGCRADDTCETRGLVNVTGSVGNGQTFQTELYQTNNFEKYDQIYFGYIEAGSENFRPTVTVAPSSGQTGPITVVAQRIGFTLIDSTGGLNSLYEYDPEANSDEIELGMTVVDKAGKALNTGAEINALVSSELVTFVGGNYSSDEYDNIFAINETGWSSLPQGGLNGAVLAMYLNGTSLYVGGEFTTNGRDESKQLNNICVYDTSTNEWGTIGGGVNGKVTNIVPITFNITADTPELVISISGDFNETTAFGDNEATNVSNFAIWVPSRANWLQNLQLTEMSFQGSLTAAVNLPDDIGTLYAGSLSSSDVGANGAAMFAKDKLARFPVEIERSAVTQGPITKRATAQNISISGVATGKFFEEDGLNLTILGGHFTSKASDGTPINNLILVNSSNAESVQGIAELTSESTILSMDISDNILFAGGVISGTANGAELNGLVTYNLKSASLPTQPPPLDGENVVVYAVAVKENNDDMYVAGSFERAGSLPCPGVCVFRKSESRWERPGMGFTGVVQAMEWKDKDKLIVAGELEVNGNATTVATYNAANQKWEEFPGAGDIPGPVVALTPANREASELWVAGVSTNGSTFLMKYKDKKWQSVQDLGEETTIRGLKVLTVSKDHESSDLLSRNQVLVLTGSIAIAGFGSAGAAIYDGKTFRPYILTSATDGSGYLAQFFSQRRNTFESASKPLALGFIVLIALAIALALTFLLFLIGVLLDRWHKKREGYMPAPTSTFDKSAQMSRLPPEEIFGTINKGNRAPVI